jgi:hypothetical protein
LIILSSALLPAGMDAVCVAGMMALGALGAMIVSGALSADRRENDVYLMELPPLRKPNIGKILLRSLLDRTLKVAGRAIAVAAPAGAVIWLLNEWGAVVYLSEWLDAMGNLLGMNGIILLAYVLSIPANELLLPLKKSKNKEEKLKMMGVGGPLLYASPSTGLVALVETRYKFMVFGKSELACVYRIADLMQYDFEEETTKNSEGKEEKKQYCTMMFKDTAGMYGFRLAVSGQKEYESIAKYFDTLFGIQKTLGNSFKNAKRQLDAFKSVANTVKAAAAGTLDEAQAAQTIGALDASVYGDRTQWIEKADAALAAYK